jgi:hypothetical protein
MNLCTAPSVPAAKCWRDSRTRAIGVAAWVKRLGGIYGSGAAQFTIEHVSEIAGLLVAASGAGYELADVSLPKLNLESVFLLCVRV